MSEESLQELKKSLCSMSKAISRVSNTLGRLRNLQSRIGYDMAKENKKPFLLRNFLFLKKRSESMLELSQIEKDISAIIEEFRITATRAELTVSCFSALAELDALREENAALKAELELAQGNIPYTLWLEVCVMRREGKTDNEIAEALYDKGQGLSKSQLGALLYTGKETRPASTTLQECGTKLLR